MNFPASAPLLFAATLAVAAVAAVVTPAGAQTPHEPRVSDAAYLTLARCEGLATASGGDVSAYKAALERQGAAREGFVTDRADEMRADAMSQYRRGGEDARRHLTAERDGACAALVQLQGASQSAAMPGQNASR